MAAHVPRPNPVADREALQHPTARAVHPDLGTRQAWQRAKVYGVPAARVPTAQALKEDLEAKNQGGKIPSVVRRLGRVLPLIS